MSCDLDHTDGKNLGSHPDVDPGSNPWPVVFDDKPKSGYRVTAQCIGCDETVHVYYRQAEIVDETGDTIWEQDDV